MLLMTVSCSIIRIEWDKCLEDTNLLWNFPVEVSGYLCK
jgi:hypothetical protein